MQPVPAGLPRMLLSPSGRRVHFLPPIFGEDMASPAAHSNEASSPNNPRLDHTSVSSAGCVFVAVTAHEASKCAFTQPPLQCCEPELRVCKRRCSRQCSSLSILQEILLTLKALELAG